MRTAGRRQPPCWPPMAPADPLSARAQCTLDARLPIGHPTPLPAPSIARHLPTPSTGKLLRLSSNDCGLFHACRHSDFN
jgi:hypothetical protein